MFDAAVMPAAIVAGVAAVALQLAAVACPSSSTTAETGRAGGRPGRARRDEHGGTDGRRQQGDDERQSRPEGGHDSTVDADRADGYGPR